VRAAVAVDEFTPFWFTQVLNLLTHISFFPHLRCQIELNGRVAGCAVGDYN